MTKATLGSWRDRLLEVTFSSSHPERASHFCTGRQQDAARLLVLFPLEPLSGCNSLLWNGPSLASLTAQCSATDSASSSHSQTWAGPLPATPSEALLLLSVLRRDGECSCPRDPWLSPSLQSNPETSLFPTCSSQKQRKVRWSREPGLGYPRYRDHTGRTKAPGPK